MSKRSIKAMMLCALAGAAIAGLWVIGGDSAPISMTVRGLKAKQGREAGKENRAGL